MENRTGDSFLLLSGTTAFISLNIVQQYVSITAALVAIVSGLSAIRYYYIKSKN
jgi:uncharacterized membrane-anchored protein